MKDLKWIFFDLDDTIWDFAANSEKALSILYDKESVLAHVFGSFEKFSTDYHKLNAELWRRYHHAEISREYLLNERFRGILAAALDSAGKPLPYDIMQLADRLNSGYLATLAKQREIVDGAIETLRKLSKKHLIGVLSNGFREVQYDKLRNTGLDRFVQRTVLSDEIGIQKPDRRIFDYALEETGAKAEETLMVGDNPETDVAGALDAGWKAVYFDRFEKGGTPDGALRIKELRELVNLVLPPA